MKTTEKTAFIHMNQLGDLLFSLPVLSAARNEWKDRKLYSIVRPSLAPLIAASGLVDEVILRPKDGPVGSLALLRRLKRESFSEALLFSESPGSLTLALAAGIPRRRGFETAGLRFLLTDTVPRSGVPSIQNNHLLGVQAGLTSIGKDYVGLIRVPENESLEAGRWCSDRGIDEKNMVIIAPGASRRRKEKHWMTGRWEKLIERFRSEGLSPVAVGAPVERPELEGIFPAGKEAVFTAREGLLPLAAMMQKARLFVGIDSGAMHLAASLTVPVVALFGPTDPSQVGPQPVASHQVVKRDRMEDITVDEVWNGIARVLER